MARVDFLNVPFSIAIDEKSADRPLRSRSLPVTETMEPLSRGTKSRSERKTEKNAADMNPEAGI